MWDRYGLLSVDAPHSLDNPAIISVTLGFLTLIVVSLFTQKENATKTLKVKPVPESTI